MSGKKIKDNKSTLLSVLAITEDIQRTTGQLYDKLRNLLANPADLDSTKQVIEQLSTKINTLKKIKLAAPFTETEDVLIPHINDISPKTDPDYSQIAQDPKLTQPDTVVDYNITPPKQVDSPPVPQANNLPVPPVPSRADLPEMSELEQEIVNNRIEHAENVKKALANKRKSGPKRLPQKGKKVDRRDAKPPQNRKKAQRPPKKFNDFKGLDKNQE